MLLSDFGCGKPLTARRIMAVKVEVDKATAKMREAVAAVNATVDSVFDAHSVQIVEDPAQANGAERLTREQLHALAAVAVTRAAHDPDALDVVAITLHPDMSTEAFMTAGKGMHNQGTMEFSLSVNDQGDIKMTCSCSKEVAMITSFDGTGKVKNTQTGPGSKMEAEIVLVLQPTEMERLAGLDYSKFDDEEAKRQFAGTSNNKLAAIYTGFGPDFRLNYDNIMCSSHVKSTIN